MHQPWRRRPASLPCKPALTDFLMHPSGRHRFHITHHVCEARSSDSGCPVSMAWRSFSRAPTGARSFLYASRWLTPPANFHWPSGPPERAYG
jgi:hypothetical protein